MKYLLDTTWIVECLRGNPEIGSCIQELQQEGLAVSIVSVAELYEGVFRSNLPEANESALKDFLSAVTVLGDPQDVAGGMRYGEEKTKLLRKGPVTGALDLLIAVTVLVYGLSLASLDENFKRIEGLTLVFS